MSLPPLKVLYVTGLGRSGSTVVDNILGQYDGFFSAGEMRLAWDAARLRDRLCGCGTPIESCPVWSQVLPATPGLPGHTRYPEPRSLWLPLLAGRDPGDSGALGERVAERYRRLAAATGSRVIVDSSKKPLYAYLLESAPGIDLRVLHLVRDPRGVAFSWGKRKRQPGRGAGTRMRRHGPAVSALRWVARNVVVERRWGGDPRRYLLLRYETMMADPRETIGRITAWLGEAATPDPFLSSNDVRLRPNHTVWGNPSRFDTGEVRLSVDDAWRTELGRLRGGIVTLLAGPWMKRYGYPRVTSRDCG